MPVILIGTLDTKGIEFQFVRDLLNQAGISTLVIDAGALKQPHFQTDVPPEEGYAVAVTHLTHLQSAADRGRAI